MSLPIVLQGVGGQQNEATKTDVLSLLLFTLLRCSYYPRFLELPLSFPSLASSFFSLSVTGNPLCVRDHYQRIVVFSWYEKGGPFGGVVHELFALTRSLLSPRSRVTYIEIDYSLSLNHYANVSWQSQFNFSFSLHIVYTARCLSHSGQARSVNKIIACKCNRTAKNVPTHSRYRRL